MASPRSRTAKRDACGFVPRSTYRLWRCTVTAVTDVAPRVRRLTLTAPDFSDMTRTGADEFFGLVMPAPGQALRLPDADDENIRESVAAMPEATRPSLRWYSVRHHRPEHAEVDVDIVIHDEGPGGNFLSRVEPGVEVGYREGCGSWNSATAPQRVLLVADETALPALGAIADELRRTGTDCSGFHAVVEIPDDDHAAPLDAPFPVERLRRGSSAPGSLALPRLAELDAKPWDRAWACGEQSLAVGTRRHLVNDRGMDPATVLFSGYWRLGQSRG